MQDWAPGFRYRCDGADAGAEVDAQGYYVPIRLDGSNVGDFRGWFHSMGVGEVHLVLQ